MNNPVTEQMVALYCLGILDEEDKGIVEKAAEEFQEVRDWCDKYNHVMYGDWNPDDDNKVENAAWSGIWSVEHPGYVSTMVAGEDPKIQPGFEVGLSLNNDFFMIDLPAEKARRNGIEFNYGFALIRMKFNGVPSETQALVPVYEEMGRFKAEYKLSPERLPRSVDCYAVVDQNDEVWRLITLSLIDETRGQKDVRRSPHLSKCLDIIEEKLLNQI